MIAIIASTIGVARIPTQGSWRPLVTISALLPDLSIVFPGTEMLEVGFSGREVKLVESMLKELDKLERRTDKQQFDLRRKLWRMEADLPPVDVMFFYRAIALLGQLADAAEKVGDRLQILLAK